MTAAAYVNGKYVCYSLEGRQRHYLGCSHERPRQAIAHTNATYVSPLRTSPAEPFDPRPVTPSRSGLVSDGSAGVRELATRLRGQAGE